MLQVELKVLEGRQQGKLIPLNVKQFLIGREQDCHLRPNSDLVSRHHCVFTVDDFTVRLRDLGSTNGTFVNGERIQGQVMLKPGDNVLVGKLSFEIVVREAAAVGAGKPRSGSGPDTSASDEIPAAAMPTPESMETALNVSDTIEFPVATPGDDTTIIPSGAPLDPAAQQQQAFLQPNPYAPNPYAMPPGYGMPPGYPPGYPQGYGYPNYAMPGYMPQPGYGMPPMMPGMQPGYGMAAPAAPPAAPAAPASEVPDVILPDPATTGARAPEPVAPPPPPADGEAPAAPQQKKPSDAAADIIRMQRLRRS